MTKPTNPSQLAKSIVDEVTGQYKPEPKTDGSQGDLANADAVRGVMRQLGRKGGKARSKSLTKKQRSEIARMAAEARWKKSHG